MSDIVAYLESKGVHLKVANESNVHTACWWHGEDASDRGRLYINIDESSAACGAFMCHVCSETGGFNKIRKHFGDPPLKTSNPSAKEDDLPDDTFLGILNSAAKYYYDCLSDAPEAYRYLREKRGFTYETIEKYRLGWAPADGGLVTHLVSQGFEVEDIKRTGLVNKWGDDFFRDKITIPYMLMGQVVQIRGKDMSGKYLTPPGQQARLFNSDAAINDDSIVLTEGEFDCIVLESLGFSAMGLPGVSTWQDSWTKQLSEAKRIYICFDNDSAGRAGAEKLASKIGPRSRIVEIPDENNGRKIDISDWFVDYGKNQDDFNYLFRKAVGGLLVSVSEAYERWTEIEGNPNLVGLRWNVREIDSQMRHGMLPGQVVTLIAKSHPHDVMVPTASGLQRWGDLQVGDSVFGSNGKPTNVTQVFDLGELDTYRLTFSDKTSVLAGADHIWTVEYRYGHKREWKRKEMTTTELMAADLKKNKEWRFRIPMIGAVDYAEQDLIVPPYTLGSLIANGSLTESSVALTTPDADVVNLVKGEGIQVTARKSGNCPRYGLLGMMAPIRKLGLNVKSADKFIPDQYLRGSIEQRIMLLRGLMDGDGSNVSKSNATNRASVAYYTTSQRLADDVRQLVNSLGGTGILNTNTRMDRNGREYDDIRVSIMLPRELLLQIFTERKDSGFKYRNEHVPHRAITSIESEGRHEHRCIKVAAEDSLYAITDSYIMTHNTNSGKTLISLNLFHRMAMLKPDIKILFVSLEQTRNEWFERARRIYSFYDPWASNEDTIKYWSDKFYLVDKNKITEDDLEACIEQYEYETGSLPDFVCIDYLGYYARGFAGDEYDRTTSAIMGLKGIAKRKQIVIYAPHQVNRTGSFGKELSADMAKSSGAIEETSDMMMAIWKPDQQPGRSLDDQSGEIHMKILKSRDGATGAEIVYQFAPKTLAIIPNSDPDVSRVMRERNYARNSHSWEQVMYRYRTGDEDQMFPSEENVRRVLNSPRPT